MFRFALVKTKELPFHREVNRLIKQHPEYRQGIERGIVHLAFNPKCKPREIYLDCGGRHESDTFAGQPVPTQQCESTSQGMVV